MAIMRTAYSAILDANSRRQERAFDAARKRMNVGISSVAKLGSVAHRERYQALRKKYSEARRQRKWLDVTNCRYEICSSAVGGMRDSKLKTRLNKRLASVSWALTKLRFGFRTGLRRNLVKLSFVERVSERAAFVLSKVRRSLKTKVVKRLRVWTYRLVSAGVRMLERVAGFDAQFRSYC
jgi:hypothetical protein